MKRIPKIKTLLLENMHLANQAIYDWVSACDKKFVEIDTERSHYRREQDLHYFVMLISPDLSNIFSSSSFETMMDHECHKSFRRDVFDDPFMQLEYFTYLIKEAVGFRSKKGIQPLTININYYGEDFLADIFDGRKGRSTKDRLMLMMRHYEGHVTLNIYDEFKLIKTVTNETELGFDK